MASSSFLNKNHILKCALFIVLLALDAVKSSYAVTQADINTSASKVKQHKQTISNTESKISALEKQLWSLDKQILDQRKLVREERVANRKLSHEAKRDLKRQSFEIERIEKDLSLVDFDIEIVQRDMERDQQRHQSMNVLKQRLAESDYLARQAGFQKQLVALEEKKQPLLEEKANAQAMLNGLQEQLNAQQTGVDDAPLDQDPRISALISQRDGTTRSLNQLRASLKQQQAILNAENKRFNQLVAKFRKEEKAKQSQQAVKAAPKPKVEKPAKKPLIANAGDFSSYVFVISGSQQTNIEETLRLKSWVESYSAKYIEASWNGFSVGQGPADSAGFQEAFHEYIRQIPKNAKIILIGHGLGGGAAIEAATKIAYRENRAIDFLVVLDPIGADNLRANIVYETKSSCTRPDPNNTITNAEYIECIKSANKRTITANIKHFYNRWQKDAKGPVDYQREIPSLDANGKVVSVPTASGRFNIANGTESDQRRIYFAGAENAHTLLLQEQSRLLPKLLVQHLR